MPKQYDYVSIIKQQAKSIKDELGISHMAALERHAKANGFRHWHELRELAKAQPDHPRVSKVVFGYEDRTELLYNFSDELDNFIDDEMSGAIAETNAVGFFVDGLGAYDSEYMQDLGLLRIKAEGAYTGEQDPDKSFHGRQFKIEVRVDLVFRDGDWQVGDEDPIELLSAVNEMDAMFDAEIGAVGQCSDDKKARVSGPF